MNVTGKQSTDGTSIKPVSSLRSHFESMGNSSPGLHPPSNGLALRSVKPIEAEQRLRQLERASLDMPRTGSPWIVPANADGKSTGQDTPEIQTTRSRAPKIESIPRQRPISMGPLSPRRSPPDITVISPYSSSGNVYQLQEPGFRSQRMPPSRRVALGNNTPSYKEMPPPPHPYRSSSMDLNKMVLSEGNKVSKSSEGETELPKPVPPRVDRKGKPKIPAKPPQDLSRAALEPAILTVDDRVSPFSTPPSSDGSPTLGGTNSAKSSKTESPYLKVKRARDSYFPKIPKRHPEAVEQHSHAQELPKESKKRDARYQGFIQPGPPSRTLEHKPGLPPRPEKQVLYRTPSQPAQRITSISSAGRPSGAPTKNVISETTSHVTPQTFLPPPRRNVTQTVCSSLNNINRQPSQSTNHVIKPMEINSDRETSLGQEASGHLVPFLDYPDSSDSNRRRPVFATGTREIQTRYETRLFDVCGQYLCTTGYVTRTWDLLSGDMLMSIGHGEKEIKITALAFKPAASADAEGARLWIGSNYGDLQEVDILTQSIVVPKVSTHERREIVKIHRHQNAMWTLDDEGKLLVWHPDDSGLPSLHLIPVQHRVPKGHTYSLIVEDKLWLATGKQLRIFRPGFEDDTFSVITQPLNQPGTGEITSGAVIDDQPHCVYFGHTDGKVTVYSTTDFSCLAIVNVSVYKINSLAGSGPYLWAGYNTGMIYVYDTRARPWKVRKDWLAHENPVIGIVVDRSSVWKLGRLQVASIGSDNAVRLWDGMLQEDWLENDFQSHDTEYCNFREIKATVLTWNAGAATPTSLRYEQRDDNFFREVLQVNDPPDLLVFAFQELVDLEDKRLTAKSFFKGSRKKDPSEHEHMSHQYRDWRDYLVRYIEDNMPSDQPYHLLHVANMVGLFSCVFIKTSERGHISSVSAAEVKRGMGGLHGNKGALLLRFVLDNTSICLVNCHLAAGQSQTVSRNNDITAIFDSTHLEAETDSPARLHTFVGGGDGSMILDHEICILNGDLNYRIDTMGRDTVVKAIKVNDLSKLLERDQLLASRRRNPTFRLRSLNEFPITFAPTYKYDVGTDQYDSSEKHRSPAWCDRILYRGEGKVKQVDYRRHETRVSDHRPVSGTFKIRVKRVLPSQRELAWQSSCERFEKAREKMASAAKLGYLRDILGVHPEEAKTLI